MPATNASHASLSKVSTGLVSGVLPSRTATIPPPRSDTSTQEPCCPQRELRRQIWPSGSVASPASPMSPVGLADPEVSGNSGSGQVDCGPLFAGSQASKGPQRRDSRALWIGVAPGPAATVEGGDGGSRHTTSQLDGSHPMADDHEMRTPFLWRWQAVMRSLTSRGVNLVQQGNAPPMWLAAVRLCG